MKRQYLLYVIIIALSFGISRHVYAQSLSGSRQGCFGPSFTAVADDATAIGLNPAGLVLLQRQELNLFYTSLYGIGIHRSYLSYNLPLTDSYSLGFDWGYIGCDDDGLSYNENLFGLAFSFKYRRLLMGIKGNYYRSGASWNEANTDNGGGTSLNAGFLYLLTSRLKLAFSAQNLYNSVKFGDYDSREFEDFQYQCGLNWQIMPNWNLAGAFYDQGVSLGSEYWWRRQIALRFGYDEPLWSKKEIRQIYDDNFLSKFRFGFGYQYKFMRFDYYYNHHAHLGDNHYFTMTLYYNPHVISIKDATVSYQPIFKSLYRFYAEKPVLNVVLKNSSEEPVPINMKILFPYLMKDSYESNITIPPKSIHTYPVEVNFQNDLLLREDAVLDHIVQPEIEIEYVKDQNQKKSTKKLTAVYAMGKGKISWTNTELAASFITVDHPDIAEFAREAVKENYDFLEKNGLNNEIGRGMVVFDYLSASGIRYNPDKTTPFVKVAGNDEVFDHIQYPVELLESKIGDCDDCSVLYSSLLENLGIRTCLLDVSAPNEGHIYVMFDTDIPIEEADHTFINSDEYISYQGKAWIPVEITMLGKSFSEAYQFGLKEYDRRKKQGHIAIVDVNSARTMYKAGEIERVNVELPSKDQVQAFLENDSETFNSRYDEACPLDSALLSADSHYNKGSCLLFYHRYDKARDYLLKAVEMDQRLADAYNALGVIETKKKHYEQARKYLEEALKVAPDNEGYKMNLAILSFLSGDKTRALELLNSLEEEDLPDKNLDQLRSLMK